MKRSIRRKNINKIWITKQIKTSRDRKSIRTFN